MERLITALSGLLVLTAFGTANATVLTFDDIGPCTGLCGSLGNYGGLNWSDDFNYLHSPTYPTVNGYDYGTVSGEYVAYNGWGNSVSVADGVFDFNGAYLTGAWNEGLNIEVTGLLDGAEVYSQTVVASHSSATWFQFDFLGIDELLFESSGGTPVPGLADSGEGTHFAMDNFTFNASVPEPSSLVLMGLALAGFGVRRFNGKAA